ncbi:MAG: hypothetical protein CL910_02260 [Deltaproteobacteria bacterium]|jgi:hypothetical protein|nr:hypothetical protein [Deltaproteobacteria bacterium]
MTSTQVGGTCSRRSGACAARARAARLFEAGEQVIVFPGGAREVNRRKGEAYGDCDPGRYPVQRLLRGVAAQLS